MRTRRAAAALAAILLVTVTLTACTSDSPATTTKAGTTATTAGTPSSGAGMTISIKGFAFHPAELKVAVGSEVTVTNDDSPTHTWTADDKSSWDSGDLSPGKTFKHTFDKAGTFSYHCNIHQTMKGTVVVS
jgi:plastocyanin